MLIRTLIFANIVGFIFVVNSCKQSNNNFTPSNPKSSLLWQISGNGLQSASYLYGTIHIQDKRVFSYGDIVKNIFDSADIVAVEVELDRLDPRTAFEVSMMKDSTLPQLMTAEEYQFLESKYKELTGSSLKTAIQMKPFFISANIVQSMINKDVDVPLDLYFIQKARESEKQVVGLESLYEQISLIDELSYTQQAKMLLESLNDTIDIKKSFNQLLDAYLSMNDSLLLELTSDPSIPKEFMDKMLIGRNHLMVSRLEPLLSEGKVFTAVGAAHLFGPEGIIDLLQQKGYHVTPVRFRFEQ